MIKFKPGLCHSKILQVDMYLVPCAIQDDNIATVHTAMMSLPYTIGFSPTRWRNVVIKTESVQELPVQP